MSVSSASWRNVSLLGIDVGYSATRATTGIARYRFGRPLSLHCVRFDSDERQRACGDGPFDAIAIDGPLLPDSDCGGARACERLLSRGAFGKRCKAGFSHFGDGLKLRNAAGAIASDVIHLRRPSASVVEAFPNAFLGVMLGDVAYASLPSPIARGRKSDLFFAQAFHDQCFDRLFDHLNWHDDVLKAAIREWATPATRIAHEYRAAIVCVLTAGCALLGESVRVGDTSGGFIHLPPRALWAQWARDAMDAMPL